MPYKRAADATRCTPSQDRRNAKAQSSSAKNWPAGKASLAAPTSRGQAAAATAGKGAPAAAGKTVAISIARAALADAKEKGRPAAKPKVRPADGVFEAPVRLSQTRM